MSDEVGPFYQLCFNPLEGVHAEHFTENMQINKLLLVATLALACASSSAATGAPAWPTTNPSHRSFFCAQHTQLADQTMPPGYGQAMLKQLRRLEAAGLTSVQAIEVMRSSARCAKDAHLPVLDTLETST